MDDTPHRVSRRGLLVGTAAASALTLGPATAASARESGPTPTRSVTPLVARERIVSARTRGPGGAVTTFRYARDFHEQLESWLRFWWANAPQDWVSPLEVLGEVDADGRSMRLSGIRYLRADRVIDGFDATTTGPAYWGTLASLYHHFASVRPAGDHVRVDDGYPGPTGSPAQAEFAAAACRAVWGYRSATAGDWQAYASRALRRARSTAEVGSRSGWRAFTRATVRLGLGTESY